MTTPIGRVLVVAACAGILSACGTTPSASGDWAWTPEQDEIPAGTLPVDYYFEYPDSPRVTVGDNSALVSIQSLGANVLVPATSDSAAWVYTPMVLEVIDPGSSGLRAGSTIEVAVPGGKVGDIFTQYLWEFDKSELDGTSTYLMGWHAYAYPKFALATVVDTIYEFSADGRELTDLRREPALGAPWAPDVFDTVDVVEQLSDSGSEGEAVATAIEEEVSPPA